MKFKAVILSSILCASLATGEELTTGAETEKKRSSNIERGFRFGEFDEKALEDQKIDEEIKKIKKGDIFKVLTLILKENKKQTTLQEEIRDLLREEYDPKPKIITVNGKKCVQNYDKDCFKMPMIREIRGIPAIADAYKNPTIENITKRELWYAEYTQRVLRDAYMKGQAIRDLGPKYPLATRQLGTTDPSAGWDAPMQKLHNKNLFEKHLDKVEFNIFLGQNKGLDMFAIVPLAYVIRDNPKIKFNLIFNSQGSLDHWKKQYKNFHTARYLDNANIVVQPEAHKEFKVYTTPSVFLKDKKNNKDTLLFVGRISESTLIERSIAYYIQNNLIKRNELSGREFWNTKGSDNLIENYLLKSKGIKYEK